MRSRMLQTFRRQTSKILRQKIQLVFTLVSMNPYLFDFDQFSHIIFWLLFKIKMMTRYKLYEISFSYN